jgi:hypothetical protein
MAVSSAFAPFRLPPGAPLEEASRLAREAAAQPLVLRLGEPVPGEVAGEALADIGAGYAFALEEACRAADGAPSGPSGQLRSCLLSQLHREHVTRAAEAALGAGFAGICLDRPDAPIAQGFLGSGFCDACRAAFAKELSRTYGEHFMPVDYLALAREALASASGALGYAQLPFGRDFWRSRVAALDRAVGDYARAARDAARAAGRPFEVAAQMEAIGPAQITATRHLDAVIFPVKGEAQASGAGVFRLLRAAMGRRPCAVALSPDTPAAAVARLAAVAAACGVEAIGPDRAEAEGQLAPLRRFARLVAAQRHAPTPSDAVSECVILYSREADLWTGGDHRAQVERAGELLAGLQIQWKVVLRVADAPPQAALVLAGASALSPAEALEVKRRVEAGGDVLAFGEPGAVDEAGREAGPPLPPGKPAGVRISKGMLVTLPPLPAARPGSAAERSLLETVARAVAALLGRARRAASATGRSPLFVALHRNEERLDAHLVSLAPEPAQGTMLFLGLHVAGAVRRARFQSAGGADEKIVMNPSGYSLSTVLPAFSGYAVLSIG